MELQRRNLSMLPPHIYEGNERTCSLCQEEFEHNQQVCRLTCRHMFHASCRESFTSHSVRQPQISCPNCRGPGRMIAVWPYIDAEVVTQEHPPESGEQVPNMFDGSGSQPADAASDSYFVDGMSPGAIECVPRPNSVGGLTTLAHH